ncbi:transmembrane protein 114 [Centroberyx affinis]|uniref:transmembrane protein 114 n=1 Tax=Centroberyx affinis TaxID=166261 RepID=UPI003A5C2552
MVRLTLRALSVLAAVCGVLSFVCLVVAISTDYWYIIDTSGLVNKSSLAQSSHSGLWRVCYYETQCLSLVNPFRSTGNYTDSVRQLLHMQGTFSVLLPVSVIIMVVGGMLGFMGLLARAYLLLMMTAALLLLGSLLSLTGAGVYVAYSAVAFRELMCMLDPKALEGLRIRFGWSLTLAWISSASELITSVAFLLACRVITRQREPHSLSRESLATCTCTK